MPSKKKLTSEQKVAIIYGYKKKDTYRNIAANVGCKKSVVVNVIKRFIETGSTESRTRRSGRSRRPRLLNKRARTTLKKLVTGKKGNRRVTAAKLTNLFIAKTGIQVSEKPSVEPCMKNS